MDDETFSNLGSEETCHTISSSVNSRSASKCSIPSEQYKIIHNDKCNSKKKKVSFSESVTSSTDLPTIFTATASDKFNQQRTLVCCCKSDSHFNITDLIKAFVDPGSLSWLAPYIEGFSTISLTSKIFAVTFKPDAFGNVSTYCLTFYYKFCNGELIFNCKGLQFYLKVKLSNSFYKKIVLYPVPNDCSNNFLRKIIHKNRWGNCMLIVNHLYKDSPHLKNGVVDIFIDEITEVSMPSFIMFNKKRIYIKHSKDNLLNFKNLKNSERQSNFQKLQLDLNDDRFSGGLNDDNESLSSFKSCISTIDSKPNYSENSYLDENQGEGQFKRKFSRNFTFKNRKNMNILNEIFNKYFFNKQLKLQKESELNLKNKYFTSHQYERLHFSRTPQNNLEENENIAVLDDEVNVKMKKQFKQRKKLCGFTFLE